MPRNDHKEIENSQIHPPKDFSTATGGDTLRKDLNNSLSWDSNPFKIQGINTVDINAAPPTEVDGDRYIVIEVASTVANAGWDSAVVDQIVEYDSTVDNWGKYTPASGDIIFLTSPDDLYYYNGNEWAVLAAGGGGGGSITIDWKFSTTITDANPGSGNFRLNNATQGNATQIFVSDISNSGTDVSAILDSIKPGTDIYIQQSDDSDKYHVATVSAAITDATTYWKIPITISDSGTDLVNNKVCSFIIFGEGADFSDGGEAGGADRTLGNTDNFDLGLKTNNQVRLHIENGGDIGINTINPTNLLHLLDDSPSTDPQILIDNSLNGDAGIRFELSSSSTGLQYDWFIDYSTNEFKLIDNNEGDLLKFSYDESTLTIIPAPIFENEAIFESDVSIALDSVLRIPARDAITTINALGEMALDTLVTNWADGVLSIHDGTNLLRVIALLDSDYTSPVQGDTIVYNATNDRWERKPTVTLGKTLNIESPGSSEDITIFRTDVAITVQEVIAVSVGSTPSVTYQLKHHTDRSNAGNNLTTSAATTSTTTGNTASLSDATIPADSWVWFESTAQSGTVDILTVDIRYTED